MHNSLAIKNLAIATEALSHCQSIYMHDVEQLLKREIQKAKEEDEAPKTTTTDDEIPF